MHLWHNGKCVPTLCMWISSSIVGLSSLRVLGIVGALGDVQNKQTSLSNRPLSLKCCPRRLCASLTRAVLVTAPTCLTLPATRASLTRAVLATAPTCSTCSLSLPSCCGLQRGVVAQLLERAVLVHPWDQSGILGSVESQSLTFMYHAACLRASEALLILSCSQIQGRSRDGRVQNIEM